MSIQQIGDAHFEATDVIAAVREVLQLRESATVRRVFLSAYRSFNGCGADCTMRWRVRMDYKQFRDCGELPYSVKATYHTLVRRLPIE